FVPHKHGRGRPTLTARSTAYCNNYEYSKGALKPIVGLKGGVQLSFARSARSSVRGNELVNAADREYLFRGTLLVVVVFVGLPCAAQSSTTESSNEFWNAINASFELSGRSRITAIFEKHNGEEGAFGEEKVGAIFSYRVRLLSQLINDSD